MFVAACGASTLGLAYGLAVAEALLAPAMPSTTARAGGIFMPIINSLSLAADSKPGAPPLRRTAEARAPHQAGGVRASCSLSTAAAWPPTASPVRRRCGGAAEDKGPHQARGFGLGARSRRPRPGPDGEPGAPGGAARIGGASVLRGWPRWRGQVPRVTQGRVRPHGCSPAVVSQCSFIKTVVPSIRAVQHTPPHKCSPTSSGRCLQA